MSLTAPGGRAVPEFAPVRPRGGRHRLRRALRRRRRPVALSLALASAVLALAVPWSREREPAEAAPEVASGAREGPAPGGAERAPARLVAAPVRIADAATVRLLGPGDRVDVLAAGTEGAARVVARRALVAEVPGGGGAEREDGGAGAGALVVLTVSSDTAAKLAGAAAQAELVIVRW
ncbi:hypothetical protein E1283_15935 [Streptomyces hainanensis]|uniref:Flp pilus assembly protein RcpC/CpaB domain-containing protein n=2 Tax=Streptomyces hainanensis TaxID=402648 RepID=A0A4R4THD8_9ACTN|nr:hypothetical protein E1283_15935 [Streptomyces hainanensis]